MTDYQGAVEQALYDRLAGQVTRATVFQHVPENTPPPVVILGEIDWENEAGKESAVLLRFSVQLVAVVSGGARKPLNLLQAQVHEALHGWTPAATATVSFGEVELGSATGQEIQGPHGPVFFGQQTAVLWVQAAD